MKLKLPHSHFKFLVVSFSASKALHRGENVQFWLDVFLSNYKPCSRLKFWKCHKIEIFAFSHIDADFQTTIYAEKINVDKNG